MKAYFLVPAMALVLSAASAMAGPSYTFGTSVGVQPANVGFITLSQTSVDTLTVFVDLLPGYGFVNTGGPHTPFTFNLSGSGALSAVFVTPASGIFPDKKGDPKTFTLNSLGGDNTPYGSFGVAIDSNAGNGSSNAYYGDLKFNLTRVGGLSTDDFVTNSVGYYFGADLTNGTHTGAQAWGVRVTAVPEPETYAMLLAGLGLIGYRVRRRMADGRNPNA